ncbi:hypothetical protein [Namhaeicola litoreus]|uniref:Lipocalin-like domain-containing protein n=1 Tax=Namhaeicola litoreus TaxID=1052145 RepID=A0ABW3Y2A8_9FLAO
MLISIIAQDSRNKASEDIDPMMGNWKIDLRPTPESDGYDQSFHMKMIGEYTFTGTF